MLRGVAIVFSGGPAPGANAVIAAAASALGERGLDGHMVSVSGQLALCYVPFAELIDPDTLTTRTRFIEPGSDFHRLAQALGTRLP